MWCLKQKMVSRRERKREKMAVGPGSIECKAGHETENCCELRVRWRGLWALKGGGKHGRVKVCYKQSTVFRSRRQRKREKVMVGPGSRD